MNAAVTVPADHTDIANLLIDVVAVLRDCRAELSTLRSERQAPGVPATVQREAYSVDEVAKMLGRESYTVREWCRLGQVNARKASRCGRHQAWRITADEVGRIQDEGFLPIDPHRNIGRRPSKG